MIITESTLQAVRPAMMKPLLRVPSAVCWQKLLRKQLDCGLVADRTLKSSVADFAMHNVVDCIGSLGHSIAK